MHRSSHAIQPVLFSILICSTGGANDFTYYFSLVNILFLLHYCQYSELNLDHVTHVMPLFLFNKPSASDVCPYSIVKFKVNRQFFASFIADQVKLNCLMN